MRSAPLLAVAALVLTACTVPANAPRNELPDAAAKRSSEVLKEQPLSRGVTMTVPKGWKRTTPATLTNGTLGARIDIMVGRSTKPVTLELLQFCRMLTVDGWHCQDGMMADDKSEGTFPYDNARRHGRIAVRHYRDGTAIVLKGEWPAESERKARKDFETVFLTIDPE